MSRLPVVGGDANTWGVVLNDFLQVAHNADGTLDVTAEDIPNVPAGDVTATNVQDAINQLDTNKVDSGDILSPDDTTLEQSGATLRLKQPIATFIELAEIAAPASPSANRGRLYIQDSGGKSQLVVLFPSGTAQVIATEP